MKIFTRIALILSVVATLAGCRSFNTLSNGGKKTS